jgi:hypothetical protein
MTYSSRAMLVDVYFLTPSEGLIVPVLCWLICLLEVKSLSLLRQFSFLSLSFGAMMSTICSKILFSADLSEVVDYISVIPGLPSFDDSTVCQIIRFCSDTGVSRDKDKKLFLLGQTLLLLLLLLLFVVVVVVVVLVVLVLVVVVVLFLLLLAKVFL